ncbi:MAG: transcriptional repressor [Bacteroidota bacterium]
MERSLEVLKSNGLSKTESRKRILELFLESENALSIQAIENKLEKIDRITLYRTLKTFEAKGIIHKALDGTHHPKYAMCESQCNEHSHQDNHAHFHCTSCQQTICLESVTTPTIPDIPKGFQVKETNLILSGLCDTCSE